MYPTTIPTKNGIILKKPFALVITIAVIRNENTPTNNTYKNIKDVENKNRNLKYEKGTVFDKDGNVIKEISTGNEGEINLEGENLDYMKGAILTHNHPDGSPISAADIATGFVNADLAELRATTIQGGTYSLKPNANFTKENALNFAKEYKQIPFEAAKSVSRDF